MIWKWLALRRIGRPSRPKFGLRGHTNTKTEIVSLMLVKKIQSKLPGKSAGAAGWGAAPGTAATAAAPPGAAGGSGLMPAGGATTGGPTGPGPPGGPGGAAIRGSIKHKIQKQNSCVLRICELCGLMTNPYLCFIQNQINGKHDCAIFNQFIYNHSQHPRKSLLSALLANKKKMPNLKGSNMKEYS